MNEEPLNTRYPCIMMQKVLQGQRSKDWRCLPVDMQRGPLLVEVDLVDRILSSLAFVDFSINQRPASRPPASVGVWGFVWGIRVMGLGSRV